MIDWPLHFVIFLLGVTFATASTTDPWNTLYALTTGKIYVHLKNNDLLLFNLSLSGFSSLSGGYSVDNVNLNSGQNVTTILSPPTNSSLFLIDDELYAFSSTIDETTFAKDLCGTGTLSLMKYNDIQDSWSLINGLNFDSIEDVSYYAKATYLSSPVYPSKLYIYGGICDHSGDVSSRMISFDLNSKTFANISTLTKPKPFYGAANLLAPNPQAQLLIGGQTLGKGFLNMYQLATWDFTTGWASKVVVANSSTSDMVNSRSKALVLPVFNPLSNASISEITNSFTVELVIMIGGENSGQVAYPNIASLNMLANEWVWTPINNSNLNFDEVYGAFTVFNTLVIINSTNSLTKRSGSLASYSLSLYDVMTWGSVKSLKDNSVSGVNSGSGSNSSTTEVTKKALLGTLIPLAAISMVVMGSFVYLQKRKAAKSKQFDELQSIEYDFTNYYDHTSSINPPSQQNKSPYNMNNNDSNLTLDGASIDSWIKKRQEFEQKRVRKHTHLHSTETLSNGDFNSTISEKAAQSIEYNGYISKPTPAAIPKTPSKRSLYHSNTIGSTPMYSSLLGRSVSKLKRTFTLSGSPTRSSPINKRHSFLTEEEFEPYDENADQTYDPQLDEDSQSLGDETTVNSEEDENDSINRNSNNDNNNHKNNTDNDDDDSYVELNLDVQVLVSSKRRSVLRVVNPDAYSSLSNGLTDDEQDDELSIMASPKSPSRQFPGPIRLKLVREVSEHSIRQRTPSGRTIAEDL